MATTTTGNPVPPQTAAPPTSGLRPYRMTVEVYERIAASGALGDRSSVFLWKGQLVEKVADMTKGRRHVIALSRLARALPRLVPDGYLVEQDQPIGLGADSEPEPDLKVIRAPDTNYLGRAPQARDTPLVVEVADSSLADDTGEMLRAYAAAGVPVYWVVNIPEGRIDVYTGPSGPAAAPSYADHRSYGPGDEVPVVLDGREVGRVAVREVLP